MDNLEESLGKLLNDPNAMAQVMNLAQSLGAMQPQTEDAQPSILPSLSQGRHTALYKALEPYLSPKRREKLEKAMQLAQLSALANQALKNREQPE